MWDTIAFTLGVLDHGLLIRLFASISLVAVAILKLWHSTQQPEPWLRNPPSAPSLVPILGQLWCITTRGLNEYFSALRYVRVGQANYVAGEQLTMRTSISACQSLPIFTVQVPGQTFYIVQPSYARELAKTTHLSLSAAF